MQTITYSYHWRFLQKVGILLTIISLLGTIFFTSVYLIASHTTKPSLFIESNSNFYDSNATLIGKTQLLQNRKTLKIADVPPIVVNTVLVSEDRQFFHHHGFDVKRLVSAILINISKGSYAQGASTITQQLAKNLYLSQEKTLSRKLKEAFITMKLESSYDKEKLLEAYLNTIYFGHGVYGLETAANTYLGKESKQLSTAEATFLLSIPANPSTYDPYAHRTSVKKRQARILSALEQNGVIDQKTVNEAIKEPIDLKPINHSTNSLFTSYFQQNVLKEISTDLGHSINNNGSSIYTTFNASIQKKVESTFERFIKPIPNLQASVIVLDSQSGEIISMIGGREQGQLLFNRAISAKRQLGSTIKPILYYSALVNGFTPSTKLKSEPTEFKFEDGTKYSPKNSGNLYANDSITLAKAIAVSDNIYAVKTQQAIGTDEFMKTQNLFHLPKPTKVVPSLALGTQEATLLDITRAYAMIANGGKDVTPHFVKEVRSKSGNLIYQPTQNWKQVLKKEETMILKQLMNGMFNTTFSSYLPVTGTVILPELSKDYYGKTGTTKTDNWMVGFDSKYVVGVWVGYDHSKKLTEDEKNLAKEMWASVMDYLPDEKIKSAIPKNLVKVSVDEKTGLLYKDGCSGKVKLYYLKNTQPKNSCMKKVSLKKVKKPWYSQYLP
ncbi:transglycosylase domain-containing protein [Gottfriedia solisilvae]|uniref:Penicillin-binding protein 2D n=1 Tax=Gottfriedia solisilvae TaxID=1516104 RepID=A0A8J3F1F2_9BACI|nr:PBP1A family penicillin-binding protein [Gottfriedia solisilvae]GGI16894.1 penicillin-binding protein 2D [Gottfriedia solisilvae]